MYILGINAYHGDSSACLYADGKLLVATEEERFRRIKHWAGFPSQAIQFCLDEAGIGIQDLDHIAISRDPKVNFSRKVFMAIKNRLSVKNMLDRVKNLQKAASIPQEFATHFGILEGELKAQIHHVEHHRSHLASAYYASDFQESALLSIDGFGDFTSTMTGIGRGDDIEVLQTVSYPHSLGIFYTTFTQWLGFPHYGDEYKIMGLAPYGTPKYLPQLRKIVKANSKGLFELELDYFTHPKEGVNMSWSNGSPDIGCLFSEALLEEFGPARAKEEALTQDHRDWAASIQGVSEEIIFHILTHLSESTGMKSLCVAGGVAQNSVANGKIRLKTPFEKLYIPPAGHDAGTCIGAALWVHHQTLGLPRTAPMKHGYLGYQASRDQIVTLLAKHPELRVEELQDEALFDLVTTCLVDGGVVGWYQGRAEFGPRALGHRSILADPRRSDAKDILNSKIKRRESFRPFAPSILEDSVPEYFEQQDEVPFMEKVFVIRPEKRHQIPAVTHVDGTGRLQTVSKEAAPKYYGLIQKFGEKTGVPILLNTSFNENEPIVNLPEEALDCFLRTKMDLLVLENFVISR